MIIGELTLRDDNYYSDSTYRKEVVVINCSDPALAEDIAMSEPGADSFVPYRILSEPTLAPKVAHKTESRPQRRFRFRLCNLLLARIQIYGNHPGLKFRIDVPHVHREDDPGPAAVAEVVADALQDAAIYGKRIKLISLRYDEHCSTTLELQMES